MSVRILIRYLSVRVVGSWIKYHSGKSVRMAVRRSKHGAVSESVIVKRPLLVVDGDSFAHRAYHGLPKTILRRDGKPAGAIVGFANFLLRMYENERPRAVI